MSTVFRIFLRVLIFCAAIELLLRVSGGIFLLAQNISNKFLVKKNGVFRLLCMGDSTTIGESAYPKHLRRILNSSEGPDKFEVLIAGMSSATTNYIASRMEGWIKDYKPNMLIVMVGVNDDKFYKNKVVVKNLVVNFYVWRLAMGLFDQLLVELKKIQSAIFHSSIPIKKEELNESLAEIPEIWRVLLDSNHPDYARLKQLTELLKVAVYLSHDGKYVEAQQLFERLLNVSINKEFAQLVREEMGEFFFVRKNYQGALILAYQILEEDAYNPRVFEWMMKLSEHSEGFILVEQIFELLIKKYPDYYRYYEMYASCCFEQNLMGKQQKLLAIASDLKFKNINPLTVKNYKLMKKIADDYGLRIVFVQYPLNDVRILQRMFEYDTDYSRMIFVDNKESFEKLLSVHTYADVFVDRCCGNFGHCTDIGSAALAQNIINKINPYLQ